MNWRMLLWREELFMYQKELCIEFAVYVTVVVIRNALDVMDMGLSMIRVLVIIVKALVRLLVVFVEDMDILMTAIKSCYYEESIMKVVYSKRSFVSIISESEYFTSLGKETGGVLLGLIRDDIYYVLESILPGFSALHKSGSFKYDTDFVDYTATHIANIYKKPLDVVGIWHTHIDAPSQFSVADELMNDNFLAMSVANRVLSVIITENSKQRINCFDISKYGTQIVNYSVDDLLIPYEFRQYKQVESDII